MEIKSFHLYYDKVKSQNVYIDILELHFFILKMGCLIYICSKKNPADR